MTAEAPLAEELLARLRHDPPTRAAGRDRAVELGLAAAFVVAAAGLATAGAGGRPFPAFEALGLVLAYALVSRAQFGIGAGYTVPTQLVFVPMLFVLPPALVPALVAAGIALGNLPDYLAGRTHPSRAASVLGDAWHALGPAAVLVAAGSPGVEASLWPVYLAALAAQFALDLAATGLREGIGRGLALREQLAPIGWVYTTDALLACAGLAAAALTGGWLLMLPVAGVLALLARERDARIDHALELSQAYRGTAMVLGDVLEEADGYTGAHSKSIVSLALSVAGELGLDERARRRVEFGALLHDVGKITIPAEIIHKPGPLDDREWEIMRTHTVAGQRILDRVGGVLAEVGEVVRASHERWDGRGYPDGLRGDQIPLEAAIVSCCDAFDAMTSDRSYRAAMAPGEAVEELRACAGSQFHPAVVETLVGVVGTD